MPFADADVSDIFSTTNCRVCLQPGDMPIFGIIDLSEHVIKFADIKIDERDDYPKYICNDCNIMLGNAISFRKTAKASDRILRHGKGFEKDESPIKYSDIDDEKAIVRENFKILFEEDNNLTKADKDSDLDEKFSDTNNFEELEHDETFYVVDSELFRDEDWNDTEPDIPRQYLEFDETTCDEYDDDISDDKFSINGDIEALENLECNECVEIFKSSEEFEEHLLLQHDTRTNVKCEICNDMVDKTYYYAHIKYHREKYKQKWDKKYCKVDCIICGISVNKSYYKTHLKTHDTSDEKAKRRKICTICNKSYNIGYFPKHMKHMHDKVKKDEDHSAKPQEADIEQELKQCPVCDKDVKEHLFKDHLAMHGKAPKQYVCDQCGKVSIHPSAFKLHCMTHGAELKYKCQFCPYRALHNGLLKVHVRTHTKDYLYRCTECPARFINKSNLSMHRRKHVRTDDFRCDICKKTFYSKRNLKHHYNSIHLGIRNVKCDLCGKAFGCRNVMLNHQKKVHKRKNITNRVGRMPSYLKLEEKKREEHKT